MPELAEVETVRRQIDLHLRGRRIKDVEVDASDRWLYAHAKPADVRRVLIGARVKGTGRRGKYLWIDFDRKPSLIVHLGMSGNVALLDPKRKKHGHRRVWGGVKLWSARDADLRRRLWFCRFLVKLDGGVELALIDPRRFGRLWLSDDPENHPRIKRLGWDPLIDFPSAKVLGEKLAKRKKAIKAVLLDQNLFAGVGNWLADEILFQARLSPRHPASKLTAAQVKALHRATLAVVKKAVAVDADDERFPKTWLFHGRWGKSKTAKTSRGLKIVHEKIGGRTTAWVPGWQK